MPDRQIAEAIGRQLAVPARSLTAEDAATRFGALAVWVANGARTRAVLGWQPGELGPVVDNGRPDSSW